MISSDGVEIKLSRSDARSEKKADLEVEGGRYIFRTVYEEVETEVEENLETADMDGEIEIA